MTANKDQKTNPQDIALFRYKVIEPLREAPPGGLYAKIRARAAQCWDIPGTARTRVAPSTMHEWLQLYKRGGFDALVPKVRRDRNSVRGLDEQSVEALLAIKTEQPLLSVRKVIEQAHLTGVIDASQPLSPSTVHRLLQREGLMAKVADATLHDRRRYAFEYANEMWQSDVLHGPGIKDRGKVRKTYLIAIIDDATRVVPYARFAFAENTQAFLPVLYEALQRRGIPKRLYVDNGAVYRSRHLEIICARLGIAIIHAAPYQPAGKEKVAYYTFMRRSVQTSLSGVCCQ